MSSIISVKNISKTFKVSKRKSGAKEALKSFFKREYKYIKAIDDISFDIEKGEIVGYDSSSSIISEYSVKMAQAQAEGAQEAQSSLLSSMADIESKKRTYGYTWI